jgi:predicted metal-dependent peptidase
MPAGLVRVLERLLEPQVDWTGKLERFVEPICAGEYSFRRPRKSSWSLGVIMPGPDGAGIHLIAHVDTSGSMQKEELEQILGELYGILDAYPHVAITLLHSDAREPQVTHLREVDKDALKDIVKLKGGGGTSHKPVVDWVLENNEDDLKALICFTDGHSDIQACFNELTGVVYRMLVLTRKDQISRLAPHCEETAYLPCHN